MLTLSINGEPQKLASALTIDQLVKHLGYERVRIAVAINGDFIARSHYSKTFANDGDNIDIVQAIGGG